MNDGPKQPPTLHCGTNPGGDEHSSVPSSKDVFIPGVNFPPFSPTFPQLSFDCWRKVQQGLRYQFPTPRVTLPDSQVPIQDCSNMSCAEVCLTLGSSWGWGIGLWATPPQVDQTKIQRITFPQTVKKFPENCWNYQFHTQKKMEIVIFWGVWEQKIMWNIIIYHFMHGTRLLLRKVAPPPTKRGCYGQAGGPSRGGGRV